VVENFILRPEAVQDIGDAYVFYEGREIGLGEEFLRCAEACLGSIRRHPRAYPTVHENYRRALIRRFPYAVFYEWSGDRIEIFAFFHCSQDPQKWRRRLP